MSLEALIQSTWTLTDLDSIFRDYHQDVDDPSEFPVLNDTDASPGHPMPYCVFEAEPNPTVIMRTTASNVKMKRYIQDDLCRFVVHARSTSELSAKELSSLLVDEIKKIFGGHPEIPPMVFPPLGIGNLLLVQYQSDWGVRTGENQYSWVVRYLFRTDNPVTT